MPRSPAKQQEPLNPFLLTCEEYDNTGGAEDIEETMCLVADYIERLHTKESSPHEREIVTSRLLGLAEVSKQARLFIGSNAQAMPLFISILRAGTLDAKLNVAATLSAMCKDDDLRIKVLLGGCIPPLLSLLKSGSDDAKKGAAEAIFEVSSGWLLDDHVGMKIFVTEGVVPTLWDQLNPKSKQDKVVQGYVTGALRNLCGDKDNFWRATLESGGLDIVVDLLSSDNAAVQSNSASLLARLLMAFGDSIPKVIESGAINALLQLVKQDNHISVWASAADALDALSSTSTKAKQIIVDEDGIHTLIGAVVAPSKTGMKGEAGQTLQSHATRALANICGGMRALILYLGELSRSPQRTEPIADVIGALAYALMVYNEDSGTEGTFDSSIIEGILIELLKSRNSKLVQDRILESMTSLYSNSCLARNLNSSEAKRLLVGLATMAVGEAHDSFIISLIRLFQNNDGLWEAFGKREGIQLLISLFGISSEHQQEYAVRFLAILTDQVDESKWAITAAGGIPPLVHLLETASHQGREDATHVLWNLCCHSEDIRACVESAEAVSALLWLLKHGRPNGQAAAAKTLIKLLRTSDSATINQLLAMLLGENPCSKAPVIKVLGHLLTISSYKDLVNHGSSANKSLRALVQVLNSSSAETQEHAASALADIFCTRLDICDDFAVDEIINPCVKLLIGNNTQVVATQLARALGALSRPIKTKGVNRMAYIAEGDVKPLIKLAKTSSINAAESSVAALANLLYAHEIAAEALAEDVVHALTKVIGEGSKDGKKNAAKALHQLLKHFPVSDVLKGDAHCRFVVLSILDFMNGLDMDCYEIADAVEVVTILARTKQGINSTFQPWAALTEVPSSLESLVYILVDGPSSLQDKVIDIMSRPCGDQPVALRNLLCMNPKSLESLADRIINSSTLKVRVSACVLLICAVRDLKLLSMEVLSLHLKPLIHALLDMMRINASSSSMEIEVRTQGYLERSVLQEGEEFDVLDPAMVLGGSVALWLLSIISSFDTKSKMLVIEAGGLEACFDKLCYINSMTKGEFVDTEGVWICTLFLAILFQEEKVVKASTTMRIIPSISHLLKSEDVIERYFAAQAIASLVSNGNKEHSLTVADSGTVAGLIALIGYSESDMPNLSALSDEFLLTRNPEVVILKHLLEIEDVRNGPVMRKSIPLLVDLLRPIADRPGAPPIAVELLIRIADGNDSNKLIMAEAGALDALTKYLSLSPKDTTEMFISELLRILFCNPEIVKHEASLSSLNQLIAVLCLGSREARLSAVKALHELLEAENIRNSEIAQQAIKPLLDMLNGNSESEHEASLTTLIKLIAVDTSKLISLGDAESNTLESLCRILKSPSSSLELKRNASELCSVLFSNPKFRINPLAVECLQPLLHLVRSDKTIVAESGLCALERLLENELLVESAAIIEGIIDLLVGLISGSNYRLAETSLSTLIKLGKDRAPTKLEMVKAGIIDKCLELLPFSPDSLSCSITQLFRILTNSSAIAKSADAAKLVEPLFTVLLRPDFSLWGQHSALQALVNIMEKPKNLSPLKLTPGQVIEPLITFLESPSQAIQQLGTELLSYLLAQDHFQQDIMTKNAVAPLVRLAGTGILTLQQMSITALEKISSCWPKAIARAGGIIELSKVIIQDDPEPPLELWETAATSLSNILNFNHDYFFKVPSVVLVKMLHSCCEDTIKVALNGLILLERTDSSSSLQMANSGAINSLLDLLRSHQCEELSGRLLEALFNNLRVREMKVSKYALGPLSQYLLDPETKSETCKLLAALALGDLSQQEGIVRSSNSVSACRALVGLLEDQTSVEMTTVALCALQNFVMNSRTNRRAVAEAGGILVVQELLLSSSGEVAGQAAMLIKFLFSNHTLQEYVSNELIRSLTAALERELWSAATINLPVLRTLNVIFTNFQKLHVSEAATLCIPHLVNALKSGSEAAQESALDTLCMLKQSWPVMPIDVATSQSMVAAEAIPFLQMLMKTCPPGFQERVELLLHCLPGCLTVTIKRGNNLKQAMSSTNAFCRLTIGNGPSRQTKVISNSTSPEWKEGFTWDFDVPPKGQKLYIICKSKNTFGKATLGRVTIQIDKVVTEGVYSGPFSLNHDSNKDGSSRTLEIEIVWTNRS